MDQPNGYSGRRTSFADKLKKMEQQLLQLYKPLTTMGLQTMSVGKLDQEAEARGWSTWFSVHLLKAVDSKGARYQTELLEVEPRLFLVSVIAMYMFAGGWHRTPLPHAYVSSPTHFARGWRAEEEGGLSQRSATFPHCPLPRPCRRKILSTSFPAEPLKQVCLATCSLPSTRMTPPMLRPSEVVCTASIRMCSNERAAKANL